MSINLRCKKCRKVVIEQENIETHPPKTGRDLFSVNLSKLLSPKCNQYFVDQTSWMTPEIERGELEGKLACPHCTWKLGNYHWQGMTCSCRQWVVPGFAIQRSRVDEVST